MSWLTDLANSLKQTAQESQGKINASMPALSNTGGTLTEMYKNSAPESLRNVFFDPSRDTGPNAAYRQATFADQIARGNNPFEGEGETEYNQNMAKRAAIVASIFGGAALAGGAGAGSAAAPVAGETAAVAAPVAVEAAAPVAYGVGAGNTAGLSLAGSSGLAGSTGAGVGGATGGAATYGLGAGGASLAPASMAIPAAAPVMTGPAAAAPSAGSWLPYASAGGTILSTLFQGLMQMEQQKEQLKREKEMAIAKSHIEKAQAENEALNRLIAVWQGGVRR
jgi:hypothetical protein